MQRLTRAFEVGALALAIAAVPMASTAADATGTALGARGNMLLKRAQSEGASTVTLIVAARPGQNRAAASAIAALGGTVRYREDDMDYLRVVVAIDKVKAVAALNSVQAVDISERVPLPDPRPDGARGTISQPGPGATTPRANPYMPIEDIKAASFMAAHPSWDGRGVTIGVLDSGVSLDHPSLLTTSTGERKVIDWVTYTDPFDDDDPTWVDMSAQVSGAQFSFKGASYTAPAAGSFRIGLFDERDPRLGGELQNDVNRDGNPSGSSGVFAVLWETSSNRVWVDTNQNRSFADEVAMRDYRVAYDVNHFGVDNPATAVAERMPFVVQTDGKNKVVNIGIIGGAHGSHVTGIAAGNALFGGAMSGVAPGAKIVSVRVCVFDGSCTLHGTVEGMIFAAKQGNVDVINMSIGGLPSLNDGNNARAILYDRLVERYNVQMFISAGNSGPGMNTIGDPSVASRVVSVGAYVSRDGLQYNYGAVSPTDTVPYADNLNYFSSPGPREDGGFKPQLVASGHAISTTPLWQPGSGLPYTLPPGYSLFNGTSMASPQAAGAAALLISAAKQTGVQKQPAQLRQALNSTTRVLDGPAHANIPIFAQGNGLLDVGAAWNLLRTNVKTTAVTASVRVDTVLSPFLATPGIGTGIYVREGLHAGESVVRTYTFVRTSGGAKPVTFNVSWVGNDGTFASAGRIALPHNKPVDFPVTISPATAGAHSAILNLDDPSTTGIDFQAMNVAVASHRFVEADGYAVTTNAAIGRAQQQRFFFEVPEGAPAFKVDFSGPSAAAGTGQARFLRWHPYGVGIDANSVTNCYVGSPCSTGSTTSRTTTNPTPGVWEVTVDARRTSDIDLAPYAMTASILGASVAPNPDVITNATVGVPVARSYMLTNLYGAFSGRAVGSTLGSARIATPSIANLGSQQHLVVVTAGSTSLRATIGGTSDPAADLDLFLYNCTTGTCVLAGQSADGDSEESVTIANPAAGTWVVLIDGFAVPAGTTTFDYVDVFVNPAFGTVSVTDADALRPAGSSWTAPGSVTAGAVPASGRSLLGTVQVRTASPENLLVGSGDVIVQSVTP
jgi:subtilisin family serine protease